MRSATGPHAKNWWVLLDSNECGSRRNNRVTACPFQPLTQEPIFKDLEEAEGFEPSLALRLVQGSNLLP